MKGKKVGKVLMIMLLVFALLIGGGFAYLYSHGMSGIASTSEAQPGQIKVACVGDSTTYGHGTTSWPKNTYPAVLQQLLGEGYHVNNYGVSSYAVQQTADRSYRSLEHYQESLAYEADYVVFMMGSNDTKPENWLGGDAFRTELESLLDSYGDAELILCTLPCAYFLEGQTVGVTSHDIQPLVAEETAQVIRDVAEDRECLLVDVYALTSGHPEWFPDGVHPTNEAAAVIAQAVADVMKAR